MGSDMMFLQQSLDRSTLANIKSTIEKAKKMDSKSDLWAKFDVAVEIACEAKTGVTLPYGQALALCKSHEQLIEVLNNLIKIIEEGTIK